jgi:hypothetical protein
VITLRDDFRIAQIDPLLSHSDKQGINLRDANEYSPRKATDPFLTGTSRQVKDRIKSEAKINGPGQMDYKSLLATVPKGLGESLLRGMDYLNREGESTLAEAAEGTGKKKGALWRAFHYGESLGLLESEQEHPRAPKIYRLVPNGWERVDELAPTLRTHGLNVEREDRRLKGAQVWADRQANDAEARGDLVTADKLNARRDRLFNARLGTLEKIYPAMEPADRILLAADVRTPNAPHPATLARLKRLHENAKMDVAEQRRQEQWTLTETTEDLRRQGLGKKDAARQLGYAGYTPNETWAAINRVWSAYQGGTYAAAN